MRVLLVDGQVFHSPAFHRGMGKYSLELLGALEQLNRQGKTWDRVEVILSSRFADDPAVTDAITARLVGGRIVKLDLKPDYVPKYHTLAAYNRVVVDAHVNGILHEDPAAVIDYLILSPMQGGICSVFPSHPAVRKSLIFYDLIPFMFHEIYFRNPLGRTEALSKTTELLRADIYLTISKTVANDLAVYLGINPERIVNIDGGAIKHSSKPKRLAVPHPFILMPTGNELRKNNRLGILGFAEFNKKHGGKYSLVITSFFDPDQVAELSQIAPNVVFTGNISGEELNFLYEECEALLFPSEYEGLGLPVLEAVEKGRPVACSDISVFREMSATAFHYFDYRFGTSIANALEAAVGSGPDLREYKAVLAKYSWPKTAKAAVDALAKTPAGGVADRPHIAVFGPNPESHHPQGRLLQRSHAALSRLFAPEYFLEGESAPDLPRASMLPFVARAALLTPGASITLPEGATPVYYLSNTAACARTLFTALANPGVVILSSLGLGAAWQALLDEGFIDESRYSLEAALAKQAGANQSDMLVSALAGQKAVVVFGHKARDAARQALDGVGAHDTPVHMLQLPTSGLVYDEVLPKRDATLATTEVSAAALKDFTKLHFAKKEVIVRPRQEVTSNSGLQVIPMPGDRQLEDMLSRLSAMYFATEDGLYDAIEAMRYGVVPVGTDAGAIDPPAAAQKTAGSGKLGPQRQDATAEVRERMGYDLYAEALYKIIKGL